MKKVLVKRLIIGFIAGAIAGNAIAIISSLFYGEFSIVTEQLKNSLGIAGAVVLQSFLSGIIGLAGIGGMTFYDIEKWSLLSATISHLASVIISFTIAYFSLGWGERSIIIYFIIFASEIVIFSIIWYIMYTMWKKSIKELNGDLLKYKEEKLNEKVE